VTDPKTNQTTSQKKENTLGLLARLFCWFLFSAPGLCPKLISGGLGMCAPCVFRGGGRPPSVLVHVLL